LFPNNYKYFYYTKFYVYFLQLHYFLNIYTNVYSKEGVLDVLYLLSQSNKHLIIRSTYNFMHLAQTTPNLNNILVWKRLDGLGYRNNNE
jgi:hypothetical protein